MKSNQKKLLKELDGVLKKYHLDEYNPEVVLEILSRSLRRKTGKAKEVFEAKGVNPALILREQRKRVRLSLNDLSKKTKIPKSNLSAMENNKRNIGVKTAKTLAKALNVNYRVFL
jgi:DNA-binding XRE family transcriptional regulator